MKPFVPTDLEVHLIMEHNVAPELISQTRDKTPRHEKLCEISHDLMHGLAGDITDHSHDDADHSSTG